MKHTVIVCNAYICSDTICNFMSKQNWTHEINENMEKRKGKVRLMCGEGVIENQTQIIALVQSIWNFMPYIRFHNFTVAWEMNFPKKKHI